MEALIKKIKNSTIRRKISLGYLGALVIAGFLVILGMMSVIGTNNRWYNMTETVYETDALVLTTRININILAKDIREAALNQDKEEREKYIHKIKEQKNQLLSNQKKLTDIQYIDQKSISQYTTQLTNWLKTADSIVRLLEGNKNKEAQKLIFEGCTPQLEQLIISANQVEGIIKKTMQEMIDFNRFISTLVIFALLVLFIIGAIVCYYFIKMINKLITQPLIEVENVLEAFSQGDLDATLTYCSQDELGVMADYLREAMHNIHLYIETIDQKMQDFSKGKFNGEEELNFIGHFSSISKSMTTFSESIRETLHRVLETSVQVEDNMKQLVGISQMVAESSVIQSHAVEQCHYTMLDISKQVESTANNASEANELAVGTRELITKSTLEMQKMLEAMERISSSSKEVGVIIQSIKEIANKTNLLALNASIEAARAGDMGRGFAVVAKEIRELASKSAEAVKTSEALLIQALNNIEEGEAISNKASNQLASAVDSTTDVLDRIEAITKESSLQVEALNTINDTVSEIASVIQENTAMTEEETTAIEQVTQQMSKLRQIVNMFEIE